MVRTLRRPSCALRSSRPTRLKGTLTLIILVRHGQSSWNAARIVQGNTAHPPLTSVGVEQAGALVPALVELAGDLGVTLVSSDAQRALQTADVLADGLASQTVSVRRVVDVRVREQCLGGVAGRHTSTLRATQIPASVPVESVRWGGGESLTNVERRLAPVVSWLSDRVAEPALTIVVSHGDTLRVLLALLRGGTAMDIEWDRPWGNGGAVALAKGDGFTPQLSALQPSLPG